MSPAVRYLSTTLALLAVAVGYTLSQRWMERPAPRPVVRELAARPAPPPAPAPSAREILDRGRALGLATEQAARLESLDRQWRRDSSELQAAIAEEQRAFAAFMKEAQGGRGASLQEIQRRSAEVGRLGTTLREARWRHTEDAVAVLTPPQRRTLETAISPAVHGDAR